MSFGRTYCDVISSSVSLATYTNYIFVCYLYYINTIIAVILYALSAVYFAGVMVRLMLTLTPVVCVLAAVAFSRVFSIYLRDDTRQTDVADDAEDDKEKNDKYYDKVCS